MEIPYKYHFSIEDFSSNYQDDLQKFIEQTGDGERIFVEYLLDKYSKIYEVFEKYEQFNIEFIDSYSTRRSLSEILGNEYSDSLNFRELGSFFNSKEAALKRFKNSILRYYEYHELEYLILCFYDEENEILRFDELGYLKHKIAFEDILNALEVIKENFSQTTSINSDFEINLINNFIWSEKVEKFINDYNKFRFYYSKHKTYKEIIYFLKYAIDADYFLHYVKGQKIAPRHYKEFIAHLMKVDIKSINDAYKNYFSKITTRKNHYPDILG